MLTLMCPNCRHRFPAPGCCNPAGSVMMQTSDGAVDQFSTSCSGSYCNGNEYLVPRGYMNGGISAGGGGGGGCCVDINTPTTILHGPQTTIIQGHNNQNHQIPQIGFINSTRWMESDNKNQQQQKHHRNIPDNNLHKKNSGISQHCKIGTTTTTTTPSTATTTGVGGITLAAHNDNNHNNNNNNKNSDNIEESMNSQCGIFQNPHPMLYPGPPSGCQDLPGLSENLQTTITPTPSTTTTTAFDFQINQETDWTRRKNLNGEMFLENISNNKLTPNFINLSSSSSSSSSFLNSVANISTIPSPSSSSSLINNSAGQIPTIIQVNATLQLPPNTVNCTVSITATANTIPNCNNNNSNRSRNNFNGGGIVNETDSVGNVVCEHRDDNNSPTTPVSWVLPFPWGVNGNTNNNSTDLERLIAAQKVLQISGWYHEGLSWQQSAALLKNTSVGSWLIRDSSDKRYMYAVSVQTARGPTAVRVHYVCGKFRLDAEPRMAPLMPMFDCPVKMIEHYIEYSKKMSEQKEVWVDHSGQLYSQIYLTKPLLKEVRSLSHLARLAVNRNNISIKQLPNPLREYIADYPYTE